MARPKAYQPTRTCIGCGRKGEKASFLRIVAAKDSVLLDPSGKTPGRGAYICPEEGCFLKMQKRRGLDRSFRRKLPKQAYEALIREYQTFEQ